VKRQLCPKNPLTGGSKGEDPNSIEDNAVAFALHKNQYITVLFVEASNKRKNNGRKKYICMNIDILEYNIFSSSLLIHQ
jgi:hypothetical protein